MVIDFATSVVPWGKVEEHARMGKPLLDGWAIGPDGEPALVPEEVHAAAAAPLVNTGSKLDRPAEKRSVLKKRSTAPAGTRQGRTDEPRRRPRPLRPQGLLPLSDGGRALRGALRGQLGKTGPNHVVLRETGRELQL